MISNKKGGSNNYGGYSQDPFEDQNEVMPEEDNSKTNKIYQFRRLHNLQY